jgi:hypothetical protein
MAGAHAPDRSEVPRSGTRAEHKTTGEVRCAPRRQLSNVVYRHLLADARVREAVRGGQTGMELAFA